ncbi:hypothetical protein [Rhizobium laguerreae]|uniref:hypothetical protein n=1 Tax=Rhizobium laguerreae TaxID=1076926 RepID=UPI0021B10B4E|nr:hypothetical protein [Rhizobium laguerreae]
MKYRTLGKSGLSVSNLILGTMGFGNETPENIVNPCAWKKDAALADFKYSR